MPVLIKPILSGNLSNIRLEAVLELLEKQSFRGYITIDPANPTTVWIVDGVIAVAFPHSIDEQASRCGIDLSDEDATHIQRQQLATHLPAVHYFQQKSLVSLSNAQAILKELTESSLVKHATLAIEDYAVYEAVQIPPEIEAMSQQLLVDQVHLLRLRDLSDWTLIEQHVGSLETVYQRVAGFSTVITRFQCSPAEQVLLTAIDGQQSLQQLVNDSSLTTLELFHCCYRLEKVGLIEKIDETSTEDRLPIIILDLDSAELAEALQPWARKREWQIIALTKVEELAAQLGSIQQAVLLYDAMCEAAIQQLDMPQVVARSMDAEALEDGQQIVKPCIISDLVSHLDELTHALPQQRFEQQPASFT